jgi:hypothetical protein
VTHVRASSLASTIFAIVASVGLSGCDGAPEPTGPVQQQRLGIAPIGEVRAAIAAQERHLASLHGTAGVVGTAVGRLPNGRLAIRVFLTSSAVRGVPASLDGFPVATQVTGQFIALSDPTTRQRPAPIGFSVGHPAITAGTIGARVIDVSGNVFVLSNNHVLANSNGAAIGDPILQPGPFDGGLAPADQIATLHAFKPIVFTSNASNTIDAAIALANPSDVLSHTAEDAYGQPNPRIFGDANDDGVFDDKMALLGVAVQKTGRTTKLTHGTITGINATLNVCYEQTFFCTKIARFVDQIIIEGAGFSGGGDSGSLIVTDDGNLMPVGLLFAGGSSQTIANRIDLVLGHFGVSIDDGDSPPPDPITDLAITSVSAPASVTVGSTANVVVTVRNVGNQPVTTDIGVSLRDATAGADVGSQIVAGGLTPGASRALTFPWNTASQELGAHVLTAAHDVSDENAANDERSATVTVNPPAIGMHVGDLDGSASGTNRWNAVVEVTIHNANHVPLNGATVVGRWSRTGLASDTCTTGELGGTGTCIFLFPSLPRNVAQVSFTITSVTRSGSTYQSGANHDPDGSSNGTTIVVRRP